MLKNKTLTYQGTSYRIKDETKTAIAVGQTADQIVWIEKKDLVALGFGAMVGKVPAWVLF